MMDDEGISPLVTHLLDASSMGNYCLYLSWNLVFIILVFHIFIFNGLFLTYSIREEGYVVGGG